MPNKLQVPDKAPSASDGGTLKSESNSSLPSLPARKRFSTAPAFDFKRRASGDIPMKDLHKADSRHLIPRSTVKKGHRDQERSSTDLHGDEGRKDKRKSALSERSKHTMDVFEGAGLLDYEEDDFTDPMQHYEAAHIVLMSQKGKHNAWEDEDRPTKEYLRKKERSRLEKLRRDRGHKVTCAFTVVYHAAILFLFLYAWVDSFKIILQEAKLQVYHLQGVYNCMEVIQKANEIQFFIEIFHALMSACVLFADTSDNAGLCLAFIFAQAVHISYKAFQIFMQFRFINQTEQLKMVGNFLLILLFNVIASIVVIQRYYDLTDRVRTRAKIVATITNVDEGGSMNEEIIYQNQSSFIRRKSILRQAVALQVYRIIQKIESCRKKGLELDKIELYKEVRAAKLAVTDVDGVENNRIMKELKRANARRLKEMEDDPMVKKLNRAKVMPTFSELFQVKLDDDVASRKQTLLELDDSARLQGNKSTENVSSTTSATE